MLPGCTQSFDKSFFTDVHCEHVYRVCEEVANCECRRPRRCRRRPPAHRLLQRLRRTDESASAHGPCYELSPRSVQLHLIGVSVRLDDEDVWVSLLTLALHLAERVVRSELLHLSDLRVCEHGLQQGAAGYILVTAREGVHVLLDDPFERPVADVGASLGGLPFRLAELLREGEAHVFAVGGKARLHRHVVRLVREKGVPRLVADEPGLASEVESLALELENVVRDAAKLRVLRRVAVCREDALDVGMAHSRAVETTVAGENLRVALRSCGGVKELVQLLNLDSGLLAVGLDLLGEVLRLVNRALHLAGESTE